MTQNVVDIVRTDKGCIKKRRRYPSHVTAISNAMETFVARCFASKNWKQADRLKYHVVTVELSTAKEREKFTQYIEQMGAHIATLSYSSAKTQRSQIVRYLDTGHKAELISRLEQNKLTLSVVCELDDDYKKIMKWLRTRMQHVDVYHDEIEVPHKRSDYAPQKLVVC